MPKRYPPLTYKEVIQILLAKGFKKVNSVGSHEKYRNGAHSVTVDNGKSPYDDFLLKSMIRQSGMDRETFYGATDKTAKKIK